MDDTFVAWRARAVERLPEFEALRDAAKAIKDHALANLDFYLERFADNVEAGGGKVHWCADADAARAAVLAICRRVGARTVTKGKTMIGEEIAINEHLAGQWHRRRWRPTSANTSSSFATRRRAI